MLRTIVLCCDGTSNQFGPTTTNVLRLVRVLEHDPLRQLVHYAPGVGTMPGPGTATWIGQKISLVSGLAFGTGLTGIVEAAYSYLMDVWVPGDQVYLFGFSRGAYTARVLAAMLHALGLLPEGNQNLVPYAMRLFQSVRSRPSQGRSKDNYDKDADNEGDDKMGNSAPNYWKLLNQFRKTFARPISLPKKPENRRFPIHFLGVWDTVSSVGWFWEPATFPYTRSNPSVSIVRHALAIDERRWLFRQNEFGLTKGQDCESRWFAGSHGDVGGGYSDSQLWRLSFEWMLSEAIAKGLIVNPDALEQLRTNAPEKPHLEAQHESLTWKWWPAEFVPKWRWQKATDTKQLRMGLGGHREIDNGALIDRSALLRMREMGYSPTNLPRAFVERVRKLGDVPNELAVEK